MRLPWFRVSAEIGSLRLPAAKVQLAVRAALAAGGAVALASWFVLAQPIYALIGAVLVTDLSPAVTRRLAVLRLVATALGATAGALLCVLLAPGPWTAAFGILVAMLLCLLVGAHEAGKVAGYICGVVVLSHAGDSWAHAWARFVETALGIGVAWVVSLLPKLVAVEDRARPDEGGE